MQVIVDGLLTHYSREGSGKIILIIPGWADTSASWAGVQKKLSENYDCIVVDLPGFGGSAAPDHAWEIADFVQFFAAFLKKVGVRKLHAVIGHSNGGSIAIRGLGTKQFEADRLVLLASAGIRNQDGSRKKALQFVAKTGKVATIALPKSARDKLRAKLYKSVGSDMLVAEHMQETFKKIVGDDVQADAAMLMMPTLLIYGENDKDTPPAFAAKYHELIRGSMLEMLPGAGHFLHVENTADVAERIRKFL